jgi:para-nitrobenzyl esterase
MDQVRLNAGSMSGLKASQNAQEIHVFRGIAYAAPPIGDSRWKPPEPTEPFAQKTFDIESGIECCG